MSLLLKIPNVKFMILCWSREARRRSWCQSTTTDYSWGSALILRIHSIQQHQQHLKKRFIERGSRSHYLNTPSLTSTNVSPHFLLAQITGSTNEAFSFIHINMVLQLSNHLICTYVCVKDKRLIIKC